ncbi:zinc finger protein 48-like [Periophthalmus magnuspinnatus]|uniref:zinc finger protein 48-like n=1 Tax=Periophthalmus magnuspinnatus TaxID=409849 RepID=UPI002436B39E|nr:zinc finger protein 48-like [Periophthalmus magnuspinnatus]
MCSHTRCIHIDTHILLTHKDGEYVSCVICNKSLRRSDLKQHLALHAGEKRHSCPICGKGFSRNTHLRGHLRTHAKHLPAGAVLSGLPSTGTPATGPALPHPPAPSAPDEHPQEQPQDLSLSSASLDYTAPVDTWQEVPESLACHICGKTYSKKSSLVSHVAENHKQPSSFKCPVCSKFLRRKSDLKRHLLTHSEDKPFQCRLCGKGFSRSDQLKGHLSAHHRPDEQPPPTTADPHSHSCPDCLFPCQSYTCPRTCQRTIHCPSCQRSYCV